MKVLAHRGLHQGEERLENSRRAVEEALASPADGLEVDLQLLADGRFLLRHDRVLTPEFFQVPRPVDVATRTLDEVRTLSTVDLLSLSEVLDLDWHQKTLVFECKPPRNRQAFARAMERVLNGRSLPEGFVLSSSDWELLNELRGRFPERSLAPVMSRLNPLDRHRANDDHWHELHLDQSLCTRDRLEKNGGPQPDRIVAWTVNDPEKRQKLERLGIKGIMTDNSDFFV